MTPSFSHGQGLSQPAAVLLAAVQAKASERFGQFVVEPTTNVPSSFCVGSCNGMGFLKVSIKAGFLDLDRLDLEIQTPQKNP